MIPRQPRSTLYPYTTLFLSKETHRFTEMPRLKPVQVAAVDVAGELADSDALRLDVNFRPGDIQFLHNHQILHARTEYEDWPEPERKRHLMRLWLAPANGRPLPPGFEARFGNIEPGPARGGIRGPGQTVGAPPEPDPYARRKNVDP